MATGKEAIEATANETQSLTDSESLGRVLRLGHAALQFQFGTDTVALPLSERTEFGSLIGTSNTMRSAFALLERSAESAATVLIEGETGTGKEGAAEGLHLASTRRDKPL